jgi:hypothetical protein
MQNGDIATLDGPWLSGDSIAGFEARHRSSTRLPLQEVEGVDVKKVNGFRTALAVTPLVVLGLWVVAFATCGDRCR